MNATETANAVPSLSKSTVGNAESIYLKIKLVYNFSLGAIECTASSVQTICHFCLYESFTFGWKHLMPLSAPCLKPAGRYVELDYQFGLEEGSASEIVFLVTKMVARIVRANDDGITDNLKVVPAHRDESVNQTLASCALVSLPLLDGKYVFAAALDIWLLEFVAGCCATSHQGGTRLDKKADQFSLVKLPPVMEMRSPIPSHREHFLIPTAIAQSPALNNTSTVR
ncbi:unnamed protein product [Schistocephalus solidus]|uniref:MATH domain-containing protein n=1 Tax=Schistocephalus solidus TaxID=70667 RepID=A0A183SQK3_SCHSO|nr:unnamed protein product [Schistocephalus solidus]